MHLLYISPSLPKFATKDLRTPLGRDRFNPLVDSLRGSNGRSCMLTLPNVSFTMKSIMARRRAMSPGKRRIVSPFINKIL